MCPGPRKHGRVIKQQQKGGGVRELISCLAFILSSLITHLVPFCKAGPHFTTVPRITIPTLSENGQLLFKGADTDLILQKNNWSDSCSSVPHGHVPDCHRLVCMATTKLYKNTFPSSMHKSKPLSFQEKRFC